MARNSTEWLGGEYDLESRGFAFFLHTKLEPKVSTALPSIYKYGIC